MGFCLKNVEESVNMMDKIYDANFGEWIRNEDNCKIVSINLKKYVKTYSVSSLITVIKWIVKDWTLKYIIIFFKKLIIDDLGVYGSEQFKKNIKVISGSIYTWNSVFISEFLMAITLNLSSNVKSKLCADILCEFENKKLIDVLEHIKNKIDPKIKAMITKNLNRNIYKNTTNKKKRTDGVNKTFFLL